MKIRNGYLRYFLISLQSIFYFHFNLQKGQEGGPRELQADQPDLHPGKGDGAAYPGGHHEASEGKKGYQE